MLRLDDIRKRAADVLPTTTYQPYGDSPTIRSYTRWELFEDAFSGDAWDRGKVIGAVPVDAIPSFSFDPSRSRALAHHFSKLPAIYTWDGSKELLLESGEGHTAQHILFCVRNDAKIYIRDVSRNSKSATLDILVRPGVSADISLLVSGSAPQYLHIRVHLGRESRFTSRLAVIGQDAHVHYEVFLNGERASTDISGGSIGGRSDVVTDVFAGSKSNRAFVRHLIFSSPGDFLAHRGVIRVERASSGAEVDMDSAFLTTGGLAVSVPQLEILTDDVVHAAHRSRDLSPDDEQVFYAQTRGLSSDAFLELYVKELLRSRVASLADAPEVQNAVKSFSESIQR